MDGISFAVRLFGLCLRLYPPEMRREYEMEMRAVFADLLADARSKGSCAVLSVVGRELCDLPASLWKAYLQTSTGDNMKRWLFSRPPVQAGALGFALAFALITLCDQLLIAMNRLVQWGYYPVTLLGTCLTALIVAWVGGSLLAQSVAPERVWAIRWALAAGWLARLLVNPATVAWVAVRFEVKAAPIFMVGMLMPGVLGGLLLAWVIGGWKWSLLGALVGLAGSWINLSLAFAYDGVMQGTLMDLLAGQMGLQQFLLLAGGAGMCLLRGAVVGGLLGLAVGAIRRWGRRVAVAAA